MKKSNKLDPLLEKAKSVLERSYGNHNVEFRRPVEWCISLSFGTLEVLGEENEEKELYIKFTKRVSKEVKETVKGELQKAGLKYSVFPGYLKLYYDENGMIFFRSFAPGLDMEEDGVGSICVETVNVRDLFRPYRIKKLCQT